MPRSLEGVDMVFLFYSYFPMVLSRSNSWGGLGEGSYSSVFFISGRTPEIHKCRYPHGGLSGSIDLGKGPGLSVVRGTPFAG